MLVSRKIAEGIYGGHRPRDVAAAVALGILAGALTGGNLSWAAVFLAATLFNVHTRLFLAAWLASVLLAWLSRGSLEQLGRFLLDGTPLGQAIGLLGDGTLVALWGWDEFTLVGGLAAGATAASVCGPIAYWTTRRLGQRWQTEANLPTCSAGPGDGPQGKERPLMQVWSSPVWYGLSSRERRVRREMAPRRLRPYGVPASLAAAATLAVASWSLARVSAERELWRELSVYNGAQVSCARTQLSLWNGEFLLHDLAIADPARPDRDRFRIGVAKGRLSPGLLLRGRLNIERLAFRQVRADVARRQPTRPYAPYNVNAVEAADRDLHVYSPSAGDLEVSPYLRSWRSVCRRLGNLQQLVAAVEQLPSAENIGEHSQRRSDLGRPQPRVVLKELRVDGLPTTWSLGSKALVQIANLSSDPTLVNKPAQVKILLPKFGAEVQLDFSSDKGRPHAVRCSACDVDLAPCFDAPLAVSGRARLAGQGSFDRERLDLRMLVEAESLAAEVTCQEPVIGIEPELWNRGLRQLAACRAQIVCFGRWTSPGLVTDSGRLLAQVEGELQAAGQEQLVAMFDKRMVQHLETQANLQEDQPAAPAVMQATAIEEQAGDIEPQAAGAEPPMPSLQPGLCEFATEEPESPVVCDSEMPRPAEEDAAPYSTFTYPTTSVPYDTEYASSPASVAYDDAERASPPLTAAPFTPPRDTPDARQRPLPGPVQMAVGRDRYTGPQTPLAAFGVEPEPAPRDGLWSRWTRGFRHKFGQVFSRPKGAPADLAESVEPESAEPYDDGEIPTATSEAWYNRLWR
jgi:hypothetical protein